MKGIILFLQKQMSIQNFLQSKVWRASDDCALISEHRCFNISTQELMFVLFQITDCPFLASCYQDAGYVTFKSELLKNPVALGKVLQRSKANRLYEEICNRFITGIGFYGNGP